MEAGIHDLVTAILKELGLGTAPMRTILIQKGHFAGFKYRFHDGGYAVWLAEKSASRSMMTRASY